MCSKRERNWKEYVGRGFNVEERQGVSEEYLHPGIFKRLYLVMYCSVITSEVIKRIKSAEQ